MAWDVSTTMTALKTTLEGAVDSDGAPRFKRVEIGYPLAPPPVGPSAYIAWTGIVTPELRMNRSVEVHMLSVRLFQAPFTNALQTIEIAGAQLVGAVADLLYADFTLGAAVRNIDFGGRYGEGFSAERDLSAVEEIPYYVADLTIPVVVDSATALVA